MAIKLEAIGSRLEGSKLTSAFVLPVKPREAEACGMGEEYSKSDAWARTKPITHTHTHLG